jgi:hypothetical protein
LTHDTWYNQECGEDEENSSDDDDGVEDCRDISDGNSSVDEEDMYV